VGVSVAGGFDWQPAVKNRHDTIKMGQTNPVGGAIARCSLFIGVLLEIDPIDRGSANSRHDDNKILNLFCLNLPKSSHLPSIPDS
jgi:hypothetical protein